MNDKEFTDKLFKIMYDLYKTIQSMLLMMVLHRGVLLIRNIVLLGGNMQN